MRILLLSPDFPIPQANATRHRIYNLIKYLGARHEMSLLAFHDPEEVPTRAEIDEVYTLGCHRLAICPWLRESLPLSIAKNLAEMSPHAFRKFRISSFRQQVKRVIKEYGTEVVHCDVNMAEMYACLPDGTASVVAPCDSFTKTMLRGAQWSKGLWQRLYYLAQAMKFFYVERRIYPRFTKCHVVSLPEARFLRRINPRIDAAIIPIGANVPDHFISESERKPSRDIVFSGQMTSPFTKDSITWFVGQVWPRIRAAVPGCRLWLVGKSPDGALWNLADADSSIQVTGFVSDIEATMRDKMVYVCPLQYGTGIKTRVLEAMAIGLPVVTTTMGAEGIDLIHDEHALISDGVDGFSSAVVRLLTTPTLRERLAEAGYTLVRRKYTWRSYAEGMERLYEDALRKVRSAPTMGLPE